MPHPSARNTLIVRAAVAAAASLAVAGVVVGMHPAHPGRPAATTSLPPGTSTSRDVIGPVRSTTSTAAPVPPPAVTPTPSASALGAQINAILTNTQSCLVVRDAAGRPLYQHAATSALAPASTQKLLIAAAALDVLGPDYRFVTKVVASSRPTGGEINDAWLVGSGDPVLSSPEYRAFLTTQPITAGILVTTPLVALATQLAGAGIHSIPGGIHGDDSLFDRTRILPSWKEDYINEGDVAPLGALEVDDGLDHWHPAIDTGDPAAHAAGVLARLANAAGVTTTQGPDGVAPAGGVVLAQVASPTLSDIVTAMLRTSDNTTAELLTRAIDRATGGAGTTPGGVAVIGRELTKLGIPTGGLVLLDGSGLSPGDRASCVTLLDALDLSAQPRFAAIGLLSVAGKFGTLVNRFLGTPAVDHLEAKTGNIAGVIGLVGRMDEGSPLSFGFLLNGPVGYAAGIGYENRLVAALGTYRA